MDAKPIIVELNIFKKTGPPPIAFTNTAGYDLMTGDWVAPYGKGINADIIFTEEFNKKSKTDYYYKLTVSFPDVGDSIQEFDEPLLIQNAQNGQSDLRSLHEAPADGYHSQLVKESYAHSGQPSRSDYNQNAIYYIRVRTKLDVNGNVASAHYGKIYGDFMQFTYYLNPTPNDRNIEFDPKQNLISGLQPVRTSESAISVRQRLCAGQQRSHPKQMRKIAIVGLVVLLNIVAFAQIPSDADLRIQITSRLESNVLGIVSNTQADVQYEFQYKQNRTNWVSLGFVPGSEITNVAPFAIFTNSLITNTSLINTKSIRVRSWVDSYKMGMADCGRSNILEI